VFWGLDKKLAQRKHFPSVNWLISYSKYSTALESFYEKFDSDFIDIRTKAREVLQREDDLNEIVQLVGKDALAESDKITLETAKLLREDYLAQNAFTPYDKYCPFYKSVWMMRNIIHFYNLANQSVERGAGMDGQKITYSLIKHHLGDLFYRLVSQKFEDPAEGEDVLTEKFKKLYEDLTAELVLGKLCCLIAHHGRKKKGNENVAFCVLRVEIRNIRICMLSDDYCLMM
nr:V-type proton ATPase catalytic subunit A [Tanacetum cinerariifolium]